MPYPFACLPTLNALQSSKYRKAQSLGTKIISEEELFDLVVASLPKEERAKIMAQAQAEKERQETEELDRLKKIAAAAPAAPPKAEGGGKKGGAAAAAKVPAVAAALWADKYRPQTVADLVGNAVSATLREPSPLHLPVASDALLSPSAGFDQEII